MYFLKLFQKYLNFIVENSLITIRKVNELHVVD